LQGERGVLQMHRPDFSVIALRQGTVCGYSPRMRFDLIVNTMFKTAMTERQIAVNNPAIWRPLYDIRDAVHAFIRAVQADLSLSGVFNVCSGNFTVGEVADQVKEEVEELINTKISLKIKNIQDFRNYKVAIEKAKNELGFLPQHSIASMVEQLFANREQYADYNRDEFFNIRTFQKLKF
jgi:nucleoside-diphosphate-sugar epimerase